MQTQKQQSSTKIRLKTTSGLDLFYNNFYTKDRQATMKPIIYQKKTLSVLWQNNLAQALKYKILSPKNSKQIKRSRSNHSPLLVKFSITNKNMIRRKSCEGEIDGRRNYKIVRFETITPQSWVQFRLVEEERIQIQKKLAITNIKMRKTAKNLIQQKLSLVNKDAGKQSVFASTNLDLTNIDMKMQLPSPSKSQSHYPGSPVNIKKVSQLKKYKSKSLDDIMFPKKEQSPQKPYSPLSEIDGELLQHIKIFIDLDKNSPKKQGSTDDQKFSYSKSVKDICTVLPLITFEDEQQHFILQESQFKRMIKPQKNSKVSIQINEPLKLLNQSQKPSILIRGPVSPSNSPFNQQHFSGNNKITSRKHMTSHASLPDSVISSQGPDSCSLSYIQNAKKPNKELYKKILYDYKKSFNILMGGSNKYKVNKTVQHYIENSQQNSSRNLYELSDFKISSELRHSPYKDMSRPCFDMVSWSGRVPQSQGSNRSGQTSALIRCQISPDKSPSNFNDKMIKRRSLQQIYKVMVNQRQIHTSTQTNRTGHLHKHFKIQ